MLEIETARLRLRRFTLDDLDDFASICSDPDVMKYIGAGKPVSREALEPIYLSGYIKYWEKHGFGRFAVIHKEYGELIGYCGLRLFNYPGLEMFDNTPEIVFLLKRTSWGMGIATEAARASLRYGFEQLKFARIVGITRRENLAAQRVLERIGMKYQNDVCYLDFDSRVYSMLRGEFQPNNFLYILGDPL
jgi:RimJ/RimL family protein N-acetyltransferase